MRPAQQTPSAARPRQPLSAAASPKQASADSSDTWQVPADDSEQLGSLPTDRVVLAQLHIQNFALVEQQHVSLGSQLVAVTGESGSGKSVLVRERTQGHVTQPAALKLHPQGYASDLAEPRSPQGLCPGACVQVECLNQLLGSPAPPECIREPTAPAVVEGSFWLPRSSALAVRRALEDEGCTQSALPAPQAGWLVIRREVSAFTTFTRETLIHHASTFCLSSVRDGQRL